MFQPVFHDTETHCYFIKLLHFMWSFFTYSCHTQNIAEFVSISTRCSLFSTWLSMTEAWFQDFPGLENVHYKFRHFPGLFGVCTVVKSVVHTWNDADRKHKYNGKQQWKLWNNNNNNNNNNNTRSSIACLTYMSRHALQKGDRVKKLK